MCVYVCDCTHLNVIHTSEILSIVDERESTRAKLEARTTLRYVQCRLHRGREGGREGREGGRGGREGGREGGEGRGGRGGGGREGENRPLTSLERLATFTNYMYVSSSFTYTLTFFT